MAYISLFFTLINRIPKISRWHSGGEVKSIEIEVGVLDYLLEERADGLTVSNRMLQEKALEIAKTVPGMEGFKVCKFLT